MIDSGCGVQVFADLIGKTSGFYLGVLHIAFLWFQKLPENSYFLSIGKTHKGESEL
jgi:hypothetical protein